jgi:TolB-like protein
VRFGELLFYRPENLSFPPEQMKKGRERKNVKYQFEGYTLDTDSLELRRNGDLVALEPQVFRLTVYLIENQDRVVSKDELIDKVWSQQVVSDSALTTCINAARVAVGDSGKRQAVIKTFPRRGFRFVADAVVLGSEPSLPEPEPLTLSGKPSIAVLPFGNLSDDPGQEFFSDGITEDLITDLSKLSNLFVIARNTSFTYKGQNFDTGEIGRKLGVLHILEGSVRKAGNRVRINAQLIDTETGGHVWADRYDGSLDDIFELQDEITAKIVAELQVKLTPQETVQTRQRVTNNVEAYELYLQGRAQWHRLDPEGTLAAVHLLREAIGIDPEFAAAYALLSGALQHGWSFAFPGFEGDKNRMLEPAQRAVELDDGLALAHARLGWALVFNDRHDEAIISFERAVALGPFDAETHLWFTETLNFAGDPARGAQVGARAFELQPSGAPGVYYLCAGHSHYLLRDYDRAEELFNGAIMRTPGFPLPYLLLGIVYYEIGQIDNAAEQFGKLHDSLPPHVLDVVVSRLPYRDEEPKRRIRTALDHVGKVG